MVFLSGFLLAICWFNALRVQGGTQWAWEVIGDVARNTSGLFAVCAAIIAAWIAFKTNRTRAEESARAHFKERLQWAVEHSRTDNNLEGFLADKFMESVEDFKYLSPRDIDIARKLIDQQIKHHQRSERHAREFQTIVNERLETLWGDYKDVALAPEQEARVKELQLEYRVLTFQLSNYNKDIQLMLMADKLREILDIYRQDDGREGTQP